MLHISKKIIIASLALLTMLFAACSVEPVTTLSATVLGDAVVYGGPRVSYDVIGRLSAESEITLNGKNGDTWVSFNYNGQTGWIQDFKLKISGNHKRLPENSSISIAIKTPTISIHSSISSNSINWRDAGKYFGEYVTVCGPVVGTNYASSSNGSPTFLNIGKDYPLDNRFVVLIWGENRNNFSFSPESYYLGKTICARGEVEIYNGIYQMEVSSPSRIEIP